MPSGHFRSRAIRVSPSNPLFLNKIGPVVQQVFLNGFQLARSTALVGTAGGEGLENAMLETGFLNWSAKVREKGHPKYARVSHVLAVRTKNNIGGQSFRLWYRQISWISCLGSDLA
jgi:hypothetical protein